MCLFDLFAEADGVGRVVLEVMLISVTFFHGGMCKVASGLEQAQLLERCELKL